MAQDFHTHFSFLPESFGIGQLGHLVRTQHREEQADQANNQQ
jgi:hypothetical protein